MTEEQLIEAAENRLEKKAEAKFLEMSSEEKINLLSNSSLEAQRNLFNKLSKDKQSELIVSLKEAGKETILRELLSSLSYDDIKSLTQDCSPEERKTIYSNLSPSQLRTLYNNATRDEKVQMAKALDQIQLGLNNNMDDEKSNIQSKTEQIATFNKTIDKLQATINHQQQNIKAQETKLAEQKIVLKKLDRERARALKQLLSAQKKASQQNKSNRIGIISKYRTKRYSQRLSDFIAKDNAVNQQKATNVSVYQEIQDLRKEVAKNENLVLTEKRKIAQAKHSIDASVYKIGELEVKLRKVSKNERRMLGRKLYNKTVSQRDCALIRKKKPILEGTFEAQRNESVTTTMEQNETIIHETEVVTPPLNTEAMVNNSIENINRIQSFGVSFYQPVMPLSGVQSKELLEIPPSATLSPQQFFVIDYTMLMMAAMMYQRQQQEMLKQTGYTRTLSKGNVNIMLLASIIFFTIGLLLFILK